ncbi:MAG: hypothetical protein SFW09_11250 [Hyphomicrobiaceae bacterium]|nr:hypothetical protein [Hyphomicrobiaceae bacterium]
MRLKSILAAVVAASAFVLALPTTSHAFGERDRPDGWGKSRHVRHWVYQPRYTHEYKIDPYHYRYSPRGYYPYYNAGYWAPAHYIKWRNRIHLNVWNAQPPRYRYYKSWGYPRKWNNRAWHNKHHGRHHLWHW